MLGIMTSIADRLTGLADTQPVVRLENRLRVGRAEQRLSQDQLARMAGVTRQTISAIENGQYCPSALLAFILARELNKPVEELFYLMRESDEQE